MRPAARRQHAGQEVDEGGLAGAVRPDQGVPRARLEPERDVVGRGEAAEALVQADRLERRGHVRSPASAARAPALRPAASARVGAAQALAPLRHRSRPTSTRTTRMRPIQNCQYCGVRPARMSCRTLKSDGADEAAVEVADAADHEHQQHVGGAVEGEHVEGDELRRLREQRAGDARIGGRRACRSRRGAGRPGCRRRGRAADCRGSARSERPKGECTMRRATTNSTNSTPRL